MVVVIVQITPHLTGLFNEPEKQTAKTTSQVVVSKLKARGLTTIVGEMEKES